MSIRLMTMVWDIRWPTQNHLLVMLKLADHANDEGSKVWPAVATIADQAQCSERTVQNVLKALRACGLIVAVRPGGGNMPTVYELNVALLRGLSNMGARLSGSADVIEIPDDVRDQAMGATGATVAPQTGATVAPHAVAPVQPETERGATEGGRGAKLLHPNHHLEPSREPPSAHASARESEGVNFGLGSEGAPRIVRKNDRTWRMWINWVFDTLGSAGHDAFVKEGEMVVFCELPHANAPRPKLPPKDPARRRELLSPKNLSARSKAMAGEGGCQ